MVLASIALLVASCGSDDSSTVTTTPPPDTSLTTLPPANAPTTTAEVDVSTTTTTSPVPDISNAINGLEAPDELVDRRLVAIKIDNHVKARPQKGLERADAVYEVLVEAGLTRFIALFHQTDVEVVGPNRSGRVTDSKLMTALSGSPLQISGAQGWVKDIYDADGINVSYDTGATTWRDDGRPRPHNLFTSTVLVRDYADRRGWSDANPGNLFKFGHEPTPGEASATTVTVKFSNSSVSTWEWDGERYLRWQGDQPHMWVDDEGESGQIAFDTIVVMKMRKYIASNPAGSGTSLPTVDTVGTGEAFVFYNGEVVGGTWERGSLRDSFKLIGADGAEMTLPPGTLWMNLIPDTMSVSWE